MLHCGFTLLSSKEGVILYLTMLRFLLGEVTFSLTGGGIEQTIQQADQCGVPLWELRVTSDPSAAGGSRLHGSTSPTGYKRLAKIAKQAGAKTTLQEKHGCVFFYQRARRRPGLLFGGMLFVALLLFSQQFIWSIELHYEDDSQSDQAYLLEVMEQHGLTPGRYARNLDFLQVQQAILTQVEDISWLSLNKRGTVLEVEVSEKVVPPHLQDKTSSNVVAKTAGIISRIDTYKGLEMVTPREVVAPGDLLVSGVMVNEEGEVSYEHADATVIANTEREHTISFDLVQEEPIPTNRIKTRRFFYLLGFRLPLFVAFSIEEPYERVVESSRLTIGKTAFAIGFDVERYALFASETRTYNRKQAEQKIEAAFLQYEQEELSRKGTQVLRVEQKVSFSKEQGGSLSIKRRYFCQENIAQKQPFYLESSPMP